MREKTIIKLLNISTDLFTAIAGIGMGIASIALPFTVFSNPIGLIMLIGAALGFPMGIMALTRIASKLRDNTEANDSSALLSRRSVIDAVSYQAAAGNNSYQNLRKSTDTAATYSAASQQPTP